MQKISSYLYSNRIQTEVNLASSTLEWRIVYQRKVKIYQGLDNVIELDVKNAEQKRQVITGFDMKFVIMDQLNQEVYTGDVDVNTGITGIAKITIPSAALEYLQPQFLKYTVYKVNSDNTKTPLYGDTQFGVTGTIDLLAGAMPSELPAQIMDTFNYLDDTSDPEYPRIFYSESIDVNPPNDITEAQSLSLEFWAAGLDATVTVQVTEDIVIGWATNWRDLETFTIASTTDRLTKIYNNGDDYSNNISWLRVKYIRATDNTGKLDKVLVRV
jgi:hypothetical protein